MKSLIVWCGPMGSAKTTSALSTARRYQRQGRRVTLIRPLVSLRPHERVGILVTKNGETFPANELTLVTDVKRTVKEDDDVVWLDEPFLFDNESALFQIVQELRKTKIILISALAADAELLPFGKSMPQFLAVADNVIFCKADCDVCGQMNQATRTLVCVDYTSLDKKVGGIESYSAACPACWTSMQQYPPAVRRRYFYTKPVPVNYQ